MRVLLTLLVAVCVFAAITAASDNPVRLTPLIHAVDPPAAKCGEQVVASGDYLGKTVVESLYLTMGEATTKVEIVNQTDTSITFKVPDKAKPGRMGVMILTTGIQPQYIDEPVSVVIE